MNDTMKLVTDYANFEGTPAQIAQQINDRVVQPLIDFACQRDADFGKRLQESMQAAQQKEGFVLVPIEPTQDMLNAGHVIMNPIKGSDVHAGTNAKRRECYKAMISAAQEAE